MEDHLTVFEINALIHAPLPWFIWPHFWRSSNDACDQLFRRLSFAFCWALFFPIKQVWLNFVIKLCIRRFRIWVCELCFITKLLTSIIIRRNPRYPGNILQSTAKTLEIFCVPTVSVWGFRNRITVCLYPKKRNHPSCVNISSTVVIVTWMKRYSRVLQHGNPNIGFLLKN